MSHGISIGVIGGGAAAVCLIDALARNAHRDPGMLTVFEPSPHLWRGRAYQVDTEDLRVNAPADDMSLRASDTGHFSRWLASRDGVFGAADDTDRLSGDRFVARSVYGEYLEQSAYAALAVLRRKGWRVDIIGESVAQAARTRSQVLLRTRQGEIRAFDYAVLAVGSGRTHDAYGLAGTAGFVADPYPVTDILRDVGDHEHVAIIGSGLTSIDVILALAARGHRGRLTLLSRSGVLPAVRQRPAAFTLKHFTPERVRSLARHRQGLSLAAAADVLRAELGSAGADLDTVAEEITRTGRENPVGRLRRQLDDIDSPNLGLRILQRAVPETGPDIWPLLRETERARVLRAHYRTLMSLCCPMPPASAVALLGLVGTGQLDILAGLRDIAPSPGGGFTVTTAGGAFRAGRVVSAVSAGVGRIPAGAASLVTSLLRGGAVTRHVHGGLDLARATSQLIARGQPDARLYGLGDIAAGALFFTFGIPSLADRGQDIAAAVFAHAESATNRFHGALVHA